MSDRAVFRDRGCVLEPLTDTQYRIWFDDEPEPPNRRGAAGWYPPIRMIERKYVTRLIEEGEFEWV